MSKTDWMLSVLGAILIVGSVGMIRQTQTLPWSLEVADKQVAAKEAARVAQEEETRRNNKIKEIYAAIRPYVFSIELNAADPALSARSFGNMLGVRVAPRCIISIAHKWPEAMAELRSRGTEPMLLGKRDYPAEKPLLLKPLLIDSDVDLAVFQMIDAPMSSWFQPMSIVSEPEEAEGDIMLRVVWFPTERERSTWYLEFVGAVAPQQFTDEAFFAFEGDVELGDSGGPIFAVDISVLLPKLVGVTTSGIVGTDNQTGLEVASGIGFAVGGTEIRSLLERVPGEACAN